MTQAIAEVSGHTHAFCNPIRMAGDRVLVWIFLASAPFFYVNDPNLAVFILRNGFPPLL